VTLPNSRVFMSRFQSCVDVWGNPLNTIKELNPIYVVYFDGSFAHAQQMCRLCVVMNQVGAIPQRSEAGSVVIDTGRSQANLRGIH
jgi:hypothetical protein